MSGAMVTKIMGISDLVICSVFEIANLEVILN